MASASYGAMPASAVWYMEQARLSIITPASITRSRGRNAPDSVNMLLKSFVKEDEIIPHAEPVRKCPRADVLPPEYDLRYEPHAVGSEQRRCKVNAHRVADGHDHGAAWVVAHKRKPKSDIPIASSTIPASMTANRRHVTPAQKLFHDIRNFLSAA